MGAQESTTYLIIVGILVLIVLIWIFLSGKKNKDNAPLKKDNKSEPELPKSQRSPLERETKDKKIPSLKTKDTHTPPQTESTESEQKAAPDQDEKESDKEEQPQESSKPDDDDDDREILSQETEEIAQENNKSEEAQSEEQEEDDASEERKSLEPKISSDEIKNERRKAFRKGLKGTRGGFIAKLSSLLKGKKTIDPDLLEKIEEILLTSDVGSKFTQRLIESLKANLSADELSDSDLVWSYMRDQATEILTSDTPSFDIESEKPFVIMVIGVNGVGKTTTIAKLASRYIKANKNVVLAAGDTFRAAAVRQLEMWGARVGADVIKNDKSGADPSAVVFDAVKKGTEEGADVVIADTAGRLHTKTPLMDELKKVKRVMGKALDGAPHEVLLVLDSNTGQNAIQQVSEFHEALGVTGIVLTKLDGTAKGGVILGICEEHKLPIRFIGVGERDDDLREFVAEDFVDVLFEEKENISESAA